MKRLTTGSTYKQPDSREICDSDADDEDDEGSTGEQAVEGRGSESQQRVDKGQGDEGQHVVEAGEGDEGQQLAKGEKQDEPVAPDGTPRISR